MESFSFKYPASIKVARRAHVGVVGSGDLEILLEPGNDQQTEFRIRTASEGFQQIWQAVLERFVALHAIDARLILNDYGATPGVVSLRLAQVLELATKNDEQ